LYENSSPFWTKLNYNVEHFTGDKWLYFAMIELDIYEDFTFIFDELFFLEVDRIYFNIFLHFWFFNKKLKINDNFYYNFLKHRVFFTLMKKKKRMRI
jgi:hypothetical protein